MAYSLRVRTRAVPSVERSGCSGSTGTIWHNGSLAVVAVLALQQAGVRYRLTTTVSPVGPCCRDGRIDATRAGDMLLLSPL